MKCASVDPKWNSTSLSLPHRRYDVVNTSLYMYMHFSFWYRAIPISASDVLGDPRLNDASQVWLGG